MNRRHESSVEPITHKALDGITSTRIRELSEYWDQLRGDRPFPMKSEVDPCRIRKLLPNLVLGEVYEDPFRLRYRLVGTEVVRLHGFDFTNQWHDEGLFGSEKPELVSCYRYMATSAAPVFGSGPLSVMEDRASVFECAVMPLADSAGRLAYCLGIQDQTVITLVELNTLPRWKVERDNGRLRTCSTFARLNMPAMD